MTAPTPIEELLVRPKLCRDCVWHREPNGLATSWRYERCGSPKNVGGFNYVTGEPLPLYTYCEEMRMAERGCGPNALWFVAKTGPAVNGAELVSDPRVTVEMDDACSKSAELREGLSEETA